MGERAHTPGRERPILFSAPMVRALLDGRKTQTRRMIPSATLDAYYEYDEWCSNVSAGVPTSRQWEEGYFLERSRIQTGDRLWVREAWRTTGCDGRSDYLPPRDLQPHPAWYEANGTAPAGELVGKLRPSMFMPRWASRLTLTVTDVRVQRLQDISEEDAVAEGIEPEEGYWRDYMMPVTQICVRAADSYRTLWDSINGAGSWETNPWVSAIAFDVKKGNIDAL